MSLRSFVRHGVNVALSRLPAGAPGGRILLYHHIGPGRDPAMFVDAALFTDQLEWISSFGMRATTVAAALDTGFPEDAVALTFDDGYGSAARACDALALRGWTATLFVVPAWCDEGRTGHLSWSDLRRLADAGCEIAAHGYDHRQVVGEAAEHDLRRAKVVIEDRIGRPVRGMSYPHGVATAAARAAAGRVYEYACTTGPRRNRRTTPRSALGRNEVVATDTTARLLRAKLGGSDDWMAAVRAFELRLRYGG